MTNVIVGVAFAVGLFLFFAGIDGMRKGSAGKPISWRDRMDGMFQSTEQWGAQLRAASPRAGKLTLAEKLSRADLKLRTSEWMLIRIGVLVALGLVTLLWRGISPHFVIAVAVGWFAPGVYLRWRQSRRLKAFNDQLGDTLVMMSNALKSGYSMAQGPRLRLHDHGPADRARRLHVLRDAAVLRAHGEQPDRHRAAGLRRHLPGPRPVHHEPDRAGGGLRCS